VQNEPVVMPGRQLPCLGVVVRVAFPAGARHVDLSIVELDEGAMQARDDQVLVVARVAYDRRSVVDPGQILEAGRPVSERPAGPDLQLRAIAGVVERRTPDRSVTVD
jgi:hypothetical protein